MSTYTSSNHDNVEICSRLGWRSTEHGSGSHRSRSNMTRFGSRGWVRRGIGGKKRRRGENRASLPGRSGSSESGTSRNRKATQRQRASHSRDVRRGREGQCSQIRVHGEDDRKLQRIKLELVDGSRSRDIQSQKKGFVYRKESRRVDQV